MPMARRLLQRRRGASAPAGAGDARSARIEPDRSARMTSSSTPAVVRTVCPYCGVGCGMKLHVAGDRVVKVEGDKDHPTNFGRLCTKGATSAGRDPGRGAARRRLSLRRAGARPGARAGRPRHRRDGAALERHPRRPRAGRALLLHLGADVARSAVPREQARQGLRRHQQRRFQLAPVHVERRLGLQAVARRRRAARRLHRHGPGGPVPHRRRQHGGLPPDPVPAGARPGEGRRPDDRRRPAALAHRRQGPPPPAAPPGHRHRAAERAPAPAARGGPRRPRLHRRPHGRVGRAVGVPRRLHARRRRRHDGPAGGGPAPRRPDDRRGRRR